MTNKEKAKNIVGSKPLSSMITTTDFEKLAVEMAEWKDKQFEYALRKAFMCDSCRNKDCRNCQVGLYIGEIRRYMTDFQE